MTEIIADMRSVGVMGAGVQVEGGAGIRDAALVGGPGATPPSTVAKCTVSCVNKYVNKLCDETRHDL